MKWYEMGDRAEERIVPPTRVEFQKAVVIDEDSIKNLFVEKNDTRIRIDEYIKQIVSETTIDVL